MTRGSDIRAAKEAHRGGVRIEHDELGRHVGHCAQEAMDDRLVPDLLGGRGCHAKVTEPEVLPWELQEVVWLHISVHQALAVQMLQPQQKLGRDVPQPLL